MKGKRMLIAASCAATLGGLGLGQGAAADAPRAGDAERGAREAGPERRHAGADLALVERPAERFERSIEAHRLESRYADLTARAAELDVEPEGNLLAQDVASAEELRRGIDELVHEVRRAEAERAEAASAGGDLGLAGGVSQATLESIAACESGGDPSAVNPAGYYGKYQFDLGTWASVGGAGNPAEAPEAEQDYRASLLLSRAGTSPWPVCGA